MVNNCMNLIGIHCKRCKELVGHVRKNGLCEECNKPNYAPPIVTRKSLIGCLMTGDPASRYMAVSVSRDDNKPHFIMWSEDPKKAISVLASWFKWRNSRFFYADDLLEDPKFIEVTHESRR